MNQWQQVETGASVCLMLHVDELMVGSLILRECLDLDASCSACSISKDIFFLKRAGDRLWQFCPTPVVAQGCLAE